MTPYEVDRFLLLFEHLKLELSGFFNCRACISIIITITGMIVDLLNTNKVDMDDSVPRLQCMVVPLFIAVLLISSPKVVMFADVIVSGS